MAEDHGSPEAEQLPRVWTRGPDLKYNLSRNMIASSFSYLSSTTHKIQLRLVDSILIIINDALSIKQNVSKQNVYISNHVKNNYFQN